VSKLPELGGGCFFRRCRPSFFCGHRIKEGIILTEAQIAALEKKQHDDEAKREGKDRYVLCGDMSYSPVT
jgi:hypothetical protein